MGRVETELRRGQQTAAKPPVFSKGNENRKQTKAKKRRPWVVCFFTVGWKTPRCLCGVSTGAEARDVTSFKERFLFKKASIGMCSWLPIPSCGRRRMLKNKNKKTKSACDRHAQRQEYPLPGPAERMEHALHGGHCTPTVSLESSERALQGGRCSPTVSLWFAHGKTAAAERQWGPCRSIPAPCFHALKSVQ